MAFKKAEVGPALAGHPISEFTVRYFDKDDNLTLRSQGSRAWRCNNPGNLKKSSYSMSKDRKAIEQIEDWQEGEEEFYEKGIISGVHKKRGAITEYLVQNTKKSIWIPKQDAIELTIEGRLHATLVHLKTGNHYLRPEHGQHGFVIIT